MRKSQSFPCPFCAVTSEKRATARAHLKKHKRALLKLLTPKRKAAAMKARRAAIKQAGAQ